MAGKINRTIAFGVFTCMAYIMLYSPAFRGELMAANSLDDPKLSHSPEEQKISHNLTKILDLPSFGETRSMWPEDPECKRFKVGFSSRLPTVWLASYPRSGNTWTRYLIEAATGVLTNSVYQDKLLPKLGYHGEMEKAGTGRCIVTKTHRELGPGEDQKVPTILLIRNPVKLIISHWSFFKGPDATKFFFTADNSTYSSSDFRRFVKKNIEVWQGVTTNRLLWSRQLLVIVYEELRSNPMGELRRILDFIGLQEDPDRMACLEKNVDGRVKGGQRGEIIPFTAIEKQDLRTAIDVVSWAAHLRGITLPDYASSLNPGAQNQTSS